MYSKQRYKICICLVILEELESFQYFFSIILPKILDPLTYYESENSFFQSEHFMLSRTWGVNCEKLSLRKS